MFYGIVGVSAVAFACSTEFVPELNEAMKLVPFTDEFKKTMTAVMVIDYAACWIIEVVLKRVFSDYRPRDIAERRPDQLAREKARRDAELSVKMADEEKKRLEKVAAFERKVEERAQRLQATFGGGQRAARQQ
jgi:manganese-transporting P-type ATPase